MLQKEDEYYKLGPHTLLSPREISFHEDFIILLRNKSVVICDRKANDSVEINFGFEFDGKMVDIFREDNTLYIYRDSEGGTNRDGTQICDW